MNIFEGRGESQEYDHEFYYARPKHDDLNKVKEEAERRQRGDYYRGPESTRVHFHAYDEPCKVGEQEHMIWEIE